MKLKDYVQVQIRLIGAAREISSLPLEDFIKSIENFEKTIPGIPEGMRETAFERLGGLKRLAVKAQDFKNMEMSFSQLMSAPVIVTSAEQAEEYHQEMTEEILKDE